MDRSTLSIVKKVCWVNFFFSYAILLPAIFLMPRPDIKP